MDVKELKKEILENTFDTFPLILKYQDNKFLCYHYVNAICKNKNKKKIFINALNELKDDSNLFDTESEYIYIYDVEKLEESHIQDYKDLIVICKSVPSDLEVDYTDIPKLISWQIEDYVKMRLPGLDDKQVKWLCDVAKYDIYRLNQECLKLEMFNKGSQKVLFEEINFENGYSDLNPLTIFNFTNAIMKKDYNSLKAILSDLENIDIEAVGMVTILIKQVKNLLDIQTNPRNTAASLNMTPGQFNAIKYNVGKFTDKQLINMFEFLTSIDCKLKSGELVLDETHDVTTKNIKLINYITLNLLALSK